jgi:hypothetical protein
MTQQAPRPARRCAAVILALVVLTPAAAQSQGFVGEVGSIWTKASYTQWSADSLFAAYNDRDKTVDVRIGDEIPFDRQTGGTLTTRTLALDLVGVPLQRLELGAHVPVVQRVEFEDDTLVTSSTGTGDIRLSAGYQLTPPGPVGTTFRVRVKIPTTEFPEELAEVPIPLSEGQYDLAFEQASTWIVNDTVHLTARGLFRFRFENSDAQIKPGDEAEFGASVAGAPIAWMWLRFGYDVLISTGKENRFDVVPSLSERKIVHDLGAGLYLKGPWGFALDLWGRHAVAGQAYPVGLTWSAGLAWATTL